MIFKLINKKLYTSKEGVLKGSLAFMQYFKFVNWLIGEFVVSFFDVTNTLYWHFFCSIITQNLSKPGQKYSKFCEIHFDFDIRIERISWKYFIIATVTVTVPFRKMLVAMEVGFLTWALPPPTQSRRPPLQG